jgi:tetratricopeptide (TPR) repeat protein
VSTMPSEALPEAVQAAMTSEDAIPDCVAAWTRAAPIDALDAPLEAAAELILRGAMRDVAGATRSAERLREATDLVGRDGPRIAARLTLGIAQTYGNAFERAIQTFDEVESIETGTTAAEVLRARVGLARVHALARLGRLDEAAAVGEQAIVRLDRLGASEFAARGHANLGVLERMRQRPASAIDRFRAALAAWGPDQVQRAQLTSNMAEAFLDLDRFDEAEGAFREALAALEAAKATHAAAIVEGNLADLLSRQGRLSEALEHYERVRRRYVSIDARGDAARLQAEEADAFAQTGLMAEAVAEYRAALEELDRHGLRLEALRARLGLARALGRLGRFHEAARVLASIEGVEQLPPASAGILKTIQGELALATGSAAVAAAALEEALPLLVARPTEEAVARTRLASARLALGNVAAAEDAAGQAMAVARSHLLRPLEAELLHVTALCARARGDEAAAMRSLRASMEAIESLRGTLQAARLRSAFVADHATAASDLVRELVRAGDGASLREALRITERVRSRSLLDAIAGAVPVDALAEHATEEAADLLRESAAIRHEANALFSRLDRQPTIASSDLWRNAVLAIESRQRLVETRLGARQATHAAIAPPPSDEAIERLVAAEHAHLVSFVAGGRLLVIACRAGRIAAADVGDATEVADRVERFRFQVHRSLMSGGERAKRIERDVDGALAALAEPMLAPFAELLADAPSLQCVPAGPLHALPFGVLPFKHVGGEPLVARMPVATVPSLGVELALVAHRSECERVSGRVVVGVPDEAAPSIATEARTIGALDGTSRLLLGPEASIDAVLRTVPGAAIFHCASHGRFVAESPLRSGVRLSDGWLTVTDLFRWRIPGTVVVVSGCDTGRVAVEGGDELTGLQRGFFAAGAAGVVLSSWLAHDEATVDWMCDFHRRLGTTMGERDSRRPASPVANPVADPVAELAGAVRAATLAARERRPRLVEWGAFGLFGGVG